MVVEDDMVRQHQQLNGHEFDQTPGDSEGQGSLACCSPWGRKESDTIQQLNNNNNILNMPNNFRAKENILLNNMKSYQKLNYFLMLILFSFSFIMFKKVKIAQLCLTLCDPMDYTGH